MGWSPHGDFHFTCIHNSGNMWILTFLTSVLGLERLSELGAERTHNTYMVRDDG